MAVQRTRLVRLTIGGMCFGAVVLSALALPGYLNVPVGHLPGGAHVQVAVKGADMENVPYGRTGMLIGRDPLTGELRAPTPQEVQQMIAGTPGLLLNRSTAGLQQVVKPDGSVEVDLQGRFRSFAVAKIAQDGSVLTGCVSTKKELEEFQNTPPTSREEGDDAK